MIGQCYPAPYAIHADAPSIGETPVHFGMLTSSKGSERLFEMIDGNKDLALLTINDDVTMRVDLVDRVFRTFLNRRWGFPSAWENLKLS